MTFIISGKNINDYKECPKIHSKNNFNGRNWLVTKNYKFLIDL